MGASASSSRRRNRDGERHEQRHQPAPTHQPPPQQHPPPPPPTQPSQVPPPRQAPPPEEAVSKARTVKNECTVIPDEVRYDAEQCVLKFATVANVPCEMEVHCAVRVDVMHGSCMITPNKPKQQPPKVSISVGEHKHEVPLDLTNVSPQEKQYIQAYPKQIPVVVVLYYGLDGDTEKHPQAEFTMIQLEPDCKMVKQLIRVDDGVYKVEHLFGGEHADLGTVVDSPVPEGADETNNATTADVEDDEEGLCVICLTNEKTTIVLPCRHLCLCKECAEELRQRSARCPVCRGPVSQMLAVR